MKEYFLLLTLLSFSLLTSCSDKSSRSFNENEEAQSEVSRTNGSNIDGIYAADLWPINHNLHFKKIGSSALVRSADQFAVKIRMQYASKMSPLKHALYTGTRCPNIKDDLNKDAYVDINEARVALGHVIIPFDTDLSSQESGLAYEAMSDENGHYAYQNSTSFDLMFSDLKAPDENPTDNLIKLEEDEGLLLGGKVILVQGLSSDITLPKTVAGDESEIPHRSLPVACGVFWKVAKLPSELSEIESQTP